MDIYDPEQVFNKAGNGIMAKAGRKLLLELADLRQQVSEAERLLDEYIDRKGIVTQYPHSLMSKVSAVIEYSGRVDDDLDEAKSALQKIT